MLSLIVFIGVCFLSAAVGSFSTGNSIQTWYRTIKKPAWNPPNYIFAPVWSVLYLMMAIAAWLVYERLNHVFINLPMLLFTIQLILNTMWSIIFFGLRSPQWAFVEVIFLWFFVGLTMVVFWTIHWIAGTLFLPYFLWVSFAAFLNFTIWRLNRKNGDTLILR